jgi:hypothetical protein
VRSRFLSESTDAAGRKARGVTLGNPRLRVARKSAVDAVKSEADRYAANVLPIIREAQKAGARTLREIAEALNARGIATARGGLWYAHEHRRRQHVHDPGVGFGPPFGRPTSPARSRHPTSKTPLKDDGRRRPSRDDRPFVCGSTRVAFQSKRKPNGRRVRLV